MVTRRTVRTLARLALGALLFSQAALASEVCGITPHTAAEAIAAGFASTEPLPPCHQHEGDEAPNPNLCLEQCLSADRSLDVPDVKVHPRPALPVLMAPPAPLAQPAIVARAAAPLAPAAAPPPRIAVLPLRI